MIENRILVRKYCKFNGDWAYIEMFDERGGYNQSRLRKTFPSCLKALPIRRTLEEETSRLLAAGWVPVDTDKHYTREFKKSVRVISPPMLAKRV